MDVILIVATLLGGGAALWYFWEKLFGTAPPDSSPTSVQSRSLNSDPTRDRIERTILESDPVADWNSGGDNNRSVVTYRHDINLRFETLYTEDGVQCANFQEPWANRHPDPNATGYWCNLYYGTTLVERFILVSVDGGRAMLPVPRIGPKGAHPDTVRKIDYKVAQIHDALQSLDEYLGRSKLKLEGGAA